MAKQAKKEKSLIELINSCETRTELKEYCRAGMTAEESAAYVTKRAAILAREDAEDRESLRIAGIVVKDQKGERKAERQAEPLALRAVNDPDFAGLWNGASRAYNLVHDGNPYAGDIVAYAVASGDDRILAAAAHWGASAPQGGESHENRGNALRDGFGPILKVVTAMEAAGKVPTGTADTFDADADWLRYAAAALAGLEKKGAKRFAEPVALIAPPESFVPDAKAKAKK